MAASALDQEAIKTLLALHDAGELQRVEELREPGPRACWQLQTTRGAYALTLHEQKPFWDLVHEKDLLLHLAAHEAELGAQVPALVANVAGGYLFPIGERYAVLCTPPPGRRLGAFEVTPEMCRKVGTLLGRFHQVAREFHGRRRHALRVEVLLRTVRNFPAREGLDPVITRLIATLHQLAPHVGRPLPAGTVHGGFGLPALRVRKDEIVAVTELGGAARGPLISDVADAIHALCFVGESLDAERTRALLAGYERVRELRPVEVRCLHGWLRLVAIRWVVWRLRDHEFGQRADEVRGHQEFTHHLGRLDAVECMGARGVARMLGLRGGGA